MIRFIREKDHAGLIRFGSIEKFDSKGLERGNWDSG